MCSLFTGCNDYLLVALDKNDCASVDTTTRNDINDQVTSNWRLVLPGADDANADDN